METGGPKASLNNAFVNAKNVNGEYMVYFADSGYEWYSINNEANNLLLWIWNDNVPGYVQIGAAYIDENDNDTLKFANGTSNPLQFYADNHHLLPTDTSKAWFWCPHDNIANGTLALKTVSPTLAAEECEKIDNIYWGAAD